MSIHVSHELLLKYNTTGPRYTSYPTAPLWRDDYGPDQHTQVILDSNPPSPPNRHPLSLYVHVPFCEERCLFCGCNVVITRQRDQADKYLDMLFQEMTQVASLMKQEPARPVIQFHWGGGTPTYLSEEQMQRLFDTQTRLFSISPNAEIAIEVDPRVTTFDQLNLLRKLGFNRISLGVQDFNAKVQEAIHRIQPLDMTGRMVDHCRDLGFEGINFDLIYGLPFQTVESFTQTIQEVIALGPDRLALYNYAHVPWLSPHQKQIPEEALPDVNTRFEILKTALEKFTEAGYEYIGMDHFAKPSDALSKAFREQRLYRNFMGYTVQNGPFSSDLYGFGVSAISGLHGFFAQNERKLSRYYEAIEANRLPVMRGYSLSQEDRLRQRVILAILCQGQVSYGPLEQDFDIDFKSHFLDALNQLTGLAADDLVELGEDNLKLTLKGRLFSRNVAMAFDAYLPSMTSDQPTFSKTV